MDKYNWEAITYPSEKYYWKLFEKNDLKIAVKFLYAKIYIYIYIYPAYVSKYDSKRQKEVHFLTILTGEGWHQIVVKKLLPLLRAITSKGNFDSHKRYRKIEFSKYQKYYRTPSNVYADFES